MADHELDVFARSRGNLFLSEIAFVQNTSTRVYDIPTENVSYYSIVPTIIWRIAALSTSKRLEYGYVWVFCFNGVQLYLGMLVLVVDIDELIHFDEYVHTYACTVG